MKGKASERNRMIFDLSSDVQMAIKLRAVKQGTTTGAIVSEAMARAFAAELEEARSVLVDQQKPGAKRPKS